MIIYLKSTIIVHIPINLHSLFLYFLKKALHFYLFIQNPYKIVYFLFNMHIYFSILYLYFLKKFLDLYLFIYLKTHYEIIQ